jgi:signal transduction histidine kinase/ABC-type sugar transport system substrate-binding protein/DNA-binding response OmpR family regulator
MIDFRKNLRKIIFAVFAISTSIIFLIIYKSLPNPAKEVFIIGFSQPTTADLWRQTMLMEMQHELIFYPNMELVVTDAENNSNKQIDDIRKLITQGIDLLIVSPNESFPLTPLVEEVYRRGIPVILIDRKIESENYTAYIGADNFEIGREAGKYAVKLLNGEGSIVEIFGLRGSSPARERHEGFMSVIDTIKNIKIIDRINGEWEFNVAKEAMNNYLKRDKSFDLIFAHNDVMAFGAYEAYKKLEIEKDVFIIGVDGMPGPDGGIQAVMDRKIDATLLYPTGGKNAINLSWDILTNMPFERENTLATHPIDSTNIMAFKLQADEILALHERIATSKRTLDDQLEKFYSQRFWLTVALISLFAVMILVGLLIRAFRNKAKANAKLKIQTEEIIRQNEKLKRISKELEEATSAKLRFFTNISHEFRTPLTLIIGPLENILASDNLTNSQKEQLDMILRNAHRLLRLINQLMDLRKIENEKMELKAGCYDIVSFVHDVKKAFDDLATKKNIDFTFQSVNESVMLYFDKDKMDKILFNILSNAFKFTEKSGKIQINLERTNHKFADGEDDAVKIEFKDNGPGISEKDLERIFDRFYQAKPDGENIYSGTGIGLPLTKGFVELHKGEIHVESKKGVGTSFLVYFRLGKNHLNEKEIVISDLGYNLIDKGIIRQTETKIFHETENPASKSDEPYENKPLLLIVEDNQDVSQFIKSSLSSDYRIMTAINGIEAFEKMYIEEPDLIISDVMMPEMNGLEFTRKLKSDIRTSHIPIILLTARISFEQKIEGLETGADSYIPKPFNKKHLQVRVNQLIENRKKIRKYYQSNPVSSFTGDERITRIDSDFLNKCIGIIHENLAETDFNVEQLAAKVGLSRVHVYRKIKHLTGLSVSEFVRNIKVKKAAILLKETNKSVTEIAYDTGFSSPSYFSKCFKDLFKITPSEFIQQKTNQ